ncbi:hypothetical protein [Simplicispira lacusdiani]|uniref:hypothetical protein n=1 Tax=Simplicispira lacusdiani TaxID=2213010 RepID=UPI000E72A9B4|nr:hypothetical protein [Simplicispira lacusdiani]
MTVQDDERERELVRMFNLDWDPEHQRHGVDALLRNIEVDGRRYQFEVEVKSSTDFSIGTARDFGMEHIRRWRSMLFVLGFYSKVRGRPELQKALCLTPMDMEPWIAEKEAQILIDFRLAARAPLKLELDDLFAVVGEQVTYSIGDAKKLHKLQWSALQYEEAADMMVDGTPRISPTGMLKILRLRAQYIAERGSTVNNPHVSKTFVRQFFGTDREVVGNAWAESIRNVAKTFIREHPEHPAAVLVQAT